MSAYYNEIDPDAAQWLRNLIARGVIAPGEVDTRSIVDVRYDDIKGFTQCHFFAGIGVWSYALRRAGWPDDRPVWTGSCPCQPFSAAGKGEGTTDARHLWPEWFRLIREHHPHVIFGEQVAASIRHSWLDLVSADLEGLDYAIGSAVMGAHSVGAPHIRQRLYFVADSEHTERRSRHQEHGDAYRRDGFGRGRDVGGLDDSASSRQQPSRSGAESQARNEARLRLPECGRATGGVEQPSSQRRERRQEAAPGHDDDGQTPERQKGEHGAGEPSPHRGPTAGFWSNAHWLPCIDGKARPVEPGTFPLVTGAAARVRRLRAYGNAINAEVARHFIAAYMETRGA